MWVEALSVPASSTQPDLSMKFIDIVREPEHLARLAWRKAYHSQIPRETAYKYLSAQQAQLLKAQDLAALRALMGRLSMRQLPGPQTTEREWLDVWGEFKARRP